MRNGWNSLVDVLGGNGPTCQRLGISLSTLQRLKAGQTSIPEASQAALQAVCERHGLPLPDPPRAPLAELHLAGMQLRDGVTPSRSWQCRLQQKYPSWQLTELAESDETPEEILRAVTYLLESE